MSSTISKQDKIYVAGHRGLVGSAIVRNLEKKGYENIVGRTHKELDLTDQAAVRAFFEQERPDVVVLAAAKVGGINANNTAPADFAWDNMQIQCNVIKAAHDFKVRKLLFLGSTCSSASTGTILSAVCPPTCTAPTTITTCPAAM